VNQDNGRAFLLPRPAFTSKYVVRPIPILAEQWRRPKKRENRAMARVVAIVAAQLARAGARLR
jgi:hypothetical protein